MLTSVGANKFNFTGGILKKYQEQSETAQKSKTLLQLPIIAGVNLSRK